MPICSLHGEKLRGLLRSEPRAELAEQAHVDAVHPEHGIEFVPGKVSFADRIRDDAQ